MLNFNTITQFSSPSFFLFIGLAFCLFWSAPSKARQFILLVLSYLFYASYQYLHVTILLLTTLIDFWFAQVIHKRRTENKSNVLFVFTCLSTNLGLLFYFKYGHMLNMVFTDFSTEKFLLPLGLSFFTLQSVGYILDVSRGKAEPEKNFVTYALFVSFFPQIIAGPIERAGEMIPQFRQKFSLKNVQWKIVCYLFFYGWFKKYIVADNLAFVLNQVPVKEDSSFFLKQLTLIFFFIRIYADFSGYTDMARAIAGIFSINLSQNFHFPLFAKSPQDFWDRWHMSLGRWIRNYFYLPLLIRFTNPYWAILIVFPVMGMWHGANVNFFYWGLCWAFVILISKFTKKLKLHSALSTLLMFNLTAFLMLFYKVNDFQELGNYLSVAGSSVLMTDHLNLLLRFSFLPLFIIIYEFYLYRKNDYVHLLKDTIYHQMAFVICIVFLGLLFSGVASQQVFYLQY